MKKIQKLIIFYSSKNNIFYQYCIIIIIILNFFFDFHIIITNKNIDHKIIYSINLHNPFFNLFFNP